jgi:hypothetical protein
MVAASSPATLATTVMLQLLVISSWPIALVQAFKFLDVPTWLRVTTMPTLQLTTVRVSSPEIHVTMVTQLPLVTKFKPIVLAQVLLYQVVSTQPLVTSMPLLQ